MVRRFGAAPLDLKPVLTANLLAHMAEDLPTFSRAIRPKMGRIDIDRGTPFVQALAGAIVGQAANIPFYLFAWIYEQKPSIERDPGFFRFREKAPLELRDMVVRIIAHDQPMKRLEPRLVQNFRRPQ